MNKVLSEFLSVLVHRTELINNRYPLLQTDGMPESILICMRVLYVTFFVMKFTIHEEVVLWKQFSNSMHFAPGIRRCLVDAPHKWLLAQWVGDLFDFNPSKLFNKQWSGQWAASPWNSCDITSLQWNLNREMYTSHFFLNALSMSSAKWQPYCLGLF